ncbi:hypothetical protein ACFLW6_02700 [Chloroflexota bacterium]
MLTHALLAVEKEEEKEYDVIVMLQPTSPFRRAEHVWKTVKKLVDSGCDSVLTVSETDSKNHPLKQLLIDGDRIDYYDKAGKHIIARQQLKPVYHRNGVAYAVTRECLLVQKTTIGRVALAVVVTDPIVNIDTPWDMQFAQWMLSQK